MSDEQLSHYTQYGALAQSLMSDPLNAYIQYQQQMQDQQQRLANAAGLTCNSMAGPIGPGHNLLLLIFEEEESCSH